MIAGKCGFWEGTIVYDDSLPEANLEEDDLWYMVFLIGIFFGFDINFDGSCIWRLSEFRDMEDSQFSRGIRY